MAATSWAAALAFVWRPENDGQPDHVDPNDPGGETNLGITIATWNAAIQSGLVPYGALSAASPDSLSTILHVLYWHPLQCDYLRPGVDLAVFNLGMVAGIGRAARLLQNAVNTTQDGIVGPKTLTAAAWVDDKVLINQFTAKEEAFYASCADAWQFLKGWDRRADDAKVAALQLIG